MKTERCARRCCRNEEGYTLLIVMFLVASLVLFLSIALPRVRTELQRDQELETVHRGQQYIRAIQLYYRRFHAFPPNADALVETNGVRFLRRKYIDPMTGKDDWRPVMFGQNKAPTAMGFFGQQLGPAGGMISGANQGNSPTGSDSNSPSVNSPVGNSDPGSGSSPNPGTPAAGPVFGGAGVIGFSPGSVRISLLVYKTKQHYDQWEFVYDPLADWNIRGQLPVFPPPAPPVNAGAPGMNYGPSGANPAANGSVSPTGNK